jgi:hypothetical protein
MHCHYFRLLAARCRWQTVQRPVTDRFWTCRCACATSRPLDDGSNAVNHIGLGLRNTPRLRLATRAMLGDGATPRARVRITGGRMNDRWNSRRGSDDRCLAEAGRGVADGGTSHVRQHWGTSSPNFVADPDRTNSGLGSTERNEQQASFVPNTASVSYIKMQRRPG